MPTQHPSEKPQRPKMPTTSYPSPPAACRRAAAVVIPGRATTASANSAGGVARTCSSRLSCRTTAAQQRRPAGSAGAIAIAGEGGGGGGGGGLGSAPLRGRFHRLRSLRHTRLVGESLALQMQPVAAAWPGLLVRRVEWLHVEGRERVAVSLSQGCPRRQIAEEVGPNVSDGQRSWW